MTIINKIWLKNEVLRLWLSGDSQQAIANQLKISVGTVNSLVDEIMSLMTPLNFSAKLQL